MRLRENSSRPVRSGGLEKGNTLKCLAGYQIDDRGDAVRPNDGRIGQLELNIKMPDRGESSEDADLHPHDLIPAVNVDHLAGDGGGTIAGKECAGGPEFVGQNIAFEWGVG